VEKQIAAFIRDVMNRAVVPSNDQYQQNLAVAKQWLEAIASGKLLVTAAPPPEKKPEDEKPQEKGAQP
jgi:hypothetical protein